LDGRKRNALERFGQSGLFENAVGRVPGFYLVIDGESTIVQRALPNFVVAFAFALHPTAGLPEELPDRGSEVGH
jgi:hypothetical protein